MHIKQEKYLFITNHEWCHREEDIDENELSSLLYMDDVVISLIQSAQLSKQRVFGILGVDHLPRNLSGYIAVVTRADNDGHRDCVPQDESLLPRF